MIIFLGLFGMGGQCTAKLTSNTVGKSRSSFAFFLAVNGIVACLFFLISGGFRIGINSITLLFSLLYAAVVLLALFCNLKALQLAEICNVNVMNSAGGLLINSAVGFLFFQEHIDFPKLLRILLMLGAVLLIFLEKRTGKKPKPGFLPVLLGMIGAGLANNLLLKFYAMTPGTANENSFFFLTNAMLTGGAALWFLALQKRVPVPLKPLLTPRSLLPFAGNTVCSNVNSLISLQLIGRLELSVYTPLTGALNVLVNLLASLLFREKLGVYSYLAAALALVATLI
ncbi:MAG: hypothetical protein IJ043_05630 [Clostridia bacterium]|nr:hypothetical protein [Clostridia bacterium]